MTICNINHHIQRYIDMIENEEIRSCKEQKALTSLVKKCFTTQDIFTDGEQLEHYISLSRYFPFERIYEWEEFITALHLTTYWTDTGQPRWPDLLAVLGRGAGKDGLIAFESVCLISQYNGIQHYDVDICANNEDQAMRPVEDVREAFEDPSHTKKLKNHFYWNKEVIVNKKTKSKIKGHTNSPKGKDGLRSGCVILNEIHQYENNKNINVFTTGLGKKKHPRMSYYTTQGDVREGVLDDMLEIAEGILFNDEPDDGLLPFICRLDSKEEVDDPKNWEKANPSLPYNTDLFIETTKEYKKWKKNPASLSAFMTKRMNLPQAESEIAVTEYENVKATNKEVPDLIGKPCICGIDFSKSNDWASVNFHFKEDEMRFDINHTWICKGNQEMMSRLKCPWQKWEEEGLLTVVDDVEIDPSLLTDYIEENMALYQIKKICLDNFRYALVSAALKKIGFSSKEYKNVKLIRPSDIMKIIPVILHCFIRGLFSWGDNPVLRWAVNNTKLMPATKAVKEMSPDVGNYLFSKIEPKSRKTDPFMALVASMTEEEALPIYTDVIPDNIDVRCYNY